MFQYGKEQLIGLNMDVQKILNLQKIGKMQKPMDYQLDLIIFLNQLMIQQNKLKLFAIMLIAPVLDCEVIGGLSTEEYQSKILTWLNYVEKHYGVTPMIYTGVNYGNTYFNNSQFAKYPLWIANWGVSKPGIPGKWTSYVYWQYSDAGSVSGISGRVDLDKTA